MLEKEYHFFEDIRDKLVKEHPDEYVVIKDNNILGFYLSIEEALKDTSKKYEIGTFIVQQCIPVDADIHRYHSRAMFS